MRARVSLDFLTRNYEGAKTGRGIEGWTALSTDANAEIGIAAIKLRNRARDLVRNNAFASKAVSTLAGNIIGTGIKPRAKSDKSQNKEKNNKKEKVEKLWKTFVKECDADGRTDFYGLQTLIVRSIIESGEVLVVIKHTTKEDHTIPLSLNVMESDHLDLSHDKELTGNGGFIQQGIEFDKNGKRIAYWLFPKHPGSMLFSQQNSVRIPAKQVLHLFDRLRPGQMRGVSWFAPALIRMQDIDDYDTAERMRKKIETCFVAFVLNSPEGEYFGKTNKDETLKLREKFKPGMIEYLPPGVDVKFGQPSATSGYSEYMRVQLHAVAAAIGLTYELLTGDLSQVNYSSIRAGLLEFRRRIIQLQQQMLIPGLCRPVWNMFVETAQAIGELPPDEIKAEWTTPRFEAVDPLKDTQADTMSVRAGFMTQKEAIARQGYDPSDTLQEISETNTELDSLGIILDTDPRKTAKTGLFQIEKEEKDAVSK